MLPPKTEPSKKLSVSLLGPGYNVSALTFFLVFLGLGSNSGHASIVIYTSESAWTSAVGTIDGTEDFNSFTTDTSFRAQAVNVNNMSIIGGTGNSIIDVPAFVSSDYDFDGTPYLLGQVTSTQRINFQFTNPVFAWGGDFRGLANSGRRGRIGIFDTNNVLVDTIIASSVIPSDQRFYGFISTEPIQRLEVYDPSGAVDVFALNDIQFSITAVPEPSSIAGFGMLAVGFAIWHRRRSRRLRSSADSPKISSPMASKKGSGSARALR